MRRRISLCYRDRWPDSLRDSGRCRSSAVMPKKSDLSAPTAGSKKYLTLQDQLDAEISMFQRDLSRTLGQRGDWNDLTSEEAQVFAIDPDRFPRMFMAFACYEAFTSR